LGGLGVFFPFPLDGCNWIMMMTVIGGRRVMLCSLVLLFLSGLFFFYLCLHVLHDLHDEMPFA
jgi:hypothetical protein